MGTDAWAEYEQRVNGQRLIYAGGVWWRAVRSLFYRPLNLLMDYPADLTGPKAGLWAGAIQYPVAPGPLAKSCIRLIMCEDAASYSMESLASPVQRHVKKGTRNFTVRLLQDPELMIRDGHSVYLEFQRRTGYQHLLARIQPEGFAAWTRNLLAIRNIRVLGAFAGESLSAIAITFRIGDTVCYNSYFGNEFAQTNRASDCMIHTVRSAAAKDPGVKKVFAAGAGMPRGLDDFYVRRGFRYVDRPAIVRGNTVVLAGLRAFAPGIHRKLFGGVGVPAPGTTSDWNSQSAEVLN